MDEVVGENFELEWNIPVSSVNEHVVVRDMVEETQKARHDAPNSYPNC